MDARSVATSIAFVVSVLAGAALGWVQGTSGSPSAAAPSDAVTTVAPVAAMEHAWTAGELPAAEGAAAGPVYTAYDGDIYAIGDSVLAGAAACLGARGVKVNAEQSRQVSAAIDILARKSSSLPPRVIVHLGTNGGASEAELDTVMALLGPNRLVLWATIQLPDDPTRYTFERSTNEAIAALTERYDNALVFDWESVSRQHPDWLYVEGIHMTPEGCEGYAGLVEPLLRAPSPYGND